MSGAGEQFHCVVYMTPGVEQVQQAAEFMYGISKNTPYLSPVQQHTIMSFPATYGWGVVLFPHSASVVRVVLPPLLLERIEVFNRGKTNVTQNQI